MGRASTAFLKSCEKYTTEMDYMLYSVFVFRVDIVSNGLLFRLSSSGRFIHTVFHIFIHINLKKG